MKTVTLGQPNSFDEWRRAARGALEARVDPVDLHWHVEGQSAALFGDEASGEAIPAELFSSPLTASGAAGRRQQFTMPRQFAQLAQSVVCHRDPERFARLYRLIWRLQTEKRLLHNEADDDVRWLNSRARSIGRDIHKMRAFVRFRRVETDVGECFVSWFEPDHLIVERTADFFARRFAGMRFSILTPDRSMHWDTRQIRFGSGCQRENAPADDDLEALWKLYYASIFNPARLKVKAMTSEMPRKYWKNLPEAQQIPALVANAQVRAEKMRAMPASMPSATAVALAQRGRSRADGASQERLVQLDTLRDQLSRCHRCALAACASQVVAGEGPSMAKLVVVGEQPGDEEDLAGRPFVGPAGKVLDRSLATLGIARQDLYLTNAVKHFKFRVRGKRRIHQRASATEIEQCRWWLAMELDAIAPTTVLALGRTAAGTLLPNRTVPLDQTGAVAVLDGAAVFVTYHPAYLLRVADAEQKRLATRRFEQTILAAWQYSQGQGLSIS